jgi:glycosyltransferase involved in cell wall biosynthesis
MRVLLAAHHLPPDGAAGVERLVQRLIPDLEAAGDSVAVVSRRIGDDGFPVLKRERLPGGGRHFRLTGGKRPLEPFLAHHERLERHFTAILADFDPDVLHVHHVFGLSPRFIEAAHRLRVPTVVSLHDYYFACPRIQLRKPSGEVCAGPDEGRECARSCYADDGADATVRWGVRDAYFRALLQLPERLIAPSRHIAGFFAQYIGDGDRVRIVPNGVAHEPRPDGPRDTPASRGCLELAYLGTIVPHKGVHVIVEALRQARLPCVRLLVAGDAADRRYLHELERAAGDVPGLQLVVHEPYELHEVPGLLEDVDCVLVPSQWPETFGIVAREALVQGVPILAARAGGLPEAVLEGQNGFTFAPDRADELAGLLRRLADDEDLLRRLRRGARETPVLSSAAHATATRMVYLEAVAERRRTLLDERLHVLHETATRLGFATV